MIKMINVCCFYYVHPLALMPTITANPSAFSRATSFEWISIKLKSIQAYLISLDKKDHVKLDAACRWWMGSNAFLICRAGAQLAGIIIRYEQYECKQLLLAGTFLKTIIGNFLINIPWNFSKSLTKSVGRARWKWILPVSSQKKCACSIQNRNQHALKTTRGEEKVSSNYKILMNPNSLLFLFYWLKLFSGAAMCSIF